MKLTTLHTSHSFPSFIRIVFFTLQLLQSSHALNPGCSPGGNFELRKFSLQLPVGQPKSPTTIGPGELHGCLGFNMNPYFYTASDGRLVMTVPGSPSGAGCVTTPNSKHCRTEFREGGKWNPWLARHRLSATLTVTDAGGSTCV